MATTTQEAPGSTGVTEAAPSVVASWLRSGDTVLVDVREDVEHAEERIEGAVHAPLSRFDAEALRAAHAGKRVVFHCRSGKRSADAAGRYRRGNEAVLHLAGGIEGWKAAGLAVVRAARGHLPIMRQVQIVAGVLVLAGVGLGVAVSPWFLGVSAFVGAGLTFAGATGWCGMAALLGRMPWNRALVRAGASTKSCCG